MVSNSDAVLLESVEFANGGKRCHFHMQKPEREKWVPKAGSLSLLFRGAKSIQAIYLTLNIRQ